MNFQQLYEYAFTDDRNTQDTYFVVRKGYKFYQHEAKQGDWGGSLESMANYLQTNVGEMIEKWMISIDDGNGGVKKITNLKGFISSPPITVFSIVHNHFSPSLTEKAYVKGDIALIPTKGRSVDIFF